MIETKMTQRQRTGVATFVDSRDVAAAPRVISAQAEIQKRPEWFDKDRCLQKTEAMDSRLCGNDRKSVGRVVPGRRSCRVAAFTMVELLVSLAVMIILLGITAVIYKSANDAMQLTNAEVVVVDDFNSLTDQVDISMDNLYTDGYLVIYGYDVRENAAAENLIVEKNPEDQVVFDGGVLPSVRSDAICFLTTGSFTSLTNKDVSANAGWVYFGHAGLINPETFGSSPFDTYSAASPLVVNRWVLSKHMLLFTPGLPSPVGIDKDYRETITYRRNAYSTDIPIKASIGAYVSCIQNDAIGFTPEEVRTWFFNNWIAENTQFYTPPRINFAGTDYLGIPAGYTFPYTLSNVGSFKVEFAMPKSYFNKIATSNFYPNDEPETYGDGNIIWRSALNLNPENPDDPDHNHPPYVAYALDGSDFSGTDPYAVLKPVNAGAAPALATRKDHQLVVFGPNDIWPLFIKITLRKYDENLAVQTDERFLYDGEDNGKTYLHGGRTLEYIYKLPVKN